MGILLLLILEKIARESRNRIITTRQTKSSCHTCPSTAQENSDRQSVLALNVIMRQKTCQKNINIWNAGTPKITEMVAI